MNILRHPDSISFLLHPAEALWLLHSFQELKQSYETSIELLPEKEQSYWKGTLTDPTHPDLPLNSESESLELERLEWKSLRSVKTIEWLHQFESFHTQKEFEFKIQKEDVDLLLQITNDRRLLLASTYDVCESDMHHDHDKLPEDPKATALIEIDFLAFFQGILLQVLLDESPL
ncbi:MAG: DUF2017 family protein [Verrucomicrobiota bacterium]